MLALCTVASADVFRPAYLELRQRTVDSYDVLWKVPIQGGMRLALTVRLPEGTAMLQPPRAQLTESAYVERWRVEHPGGLGGQSIVIDGLAGTSTDVLVRVVRSDGSEQIARLLPSATSLVVEGSAGGIVVARTYFVLGVQHILGGLDHLLFVLALLMIVKGVRRVVGTITAFTVAHSLTLAAATLGVVNVPSAPVEATIALSVVFVASEIVQGLRGRAAIAARWPWLVAFVFGLLHGLGFAGALSEVGLPNGAIPIALLFFNVGVEAGQLLFVVGCAAVAWPFRHAAREWPTWLRLAPAYVIGSIAVFWVIERVAAF